MITNAKLRSIISREGLEPGQKHCVWCGKPFTPKPGMKPYDTESLCSKERQEAQDKRLVELNEQASD